MAKLASLTGKAAESLKVKVIEETKTRRLDIQIYNKETMTLPI